MIKRNCGIKTCINIEHMSIALRFPPQGRNVLVQKLSQITIIKLVSYAHETTLHYKIDRLEGYC